MGKIIESISSLELRNIMDEHETEEVGHMDAVDEETLHMINKMKFSSIKERKDVLIKGRTKMRKLYNQTKGLTARMTKNQKDHVRKTQGHLNVGFLQALAEDINHPDTGLFDNMVNGSPTFGPIQKSNVWEVDPCHESKNEKKEAERRKKFRLREKGPEWMTDENNARVWKESEKLRTDGTLREIKPEEVTMEPTYGFGVEQGDFEVREDGSRYYVKLRPCFDYRGVNKWSPSYEKLKLTTNKQIIQWVANAVVDGDSKPPPIIPSKKDVVFDTNKELKRVVKQESVIQEEIASFMRIYNDYNPSLYNDGQQKKGSPRKRTFEEAFNFQEEKFFENNRKQRRRKFFTEGKGKGFVPGFSKLDFKSYYYQFAPKETKDNIIAMWDPAPSDDIKNGRWRYFESSVMHFGNLHSVFVACRFSLLLENIIRKFLDIIASIYIDDSIIMERMELLQLAQEIVEELYEKLGWKMSSQKLESHTLGDEIKILGIVYKRLVNGFRFFPPRTKVISTVEKIDEYCEKVMKGVFDFDELERLSGTLIFLLQMQFLRVVGCEMKTLGSWKPIENFNEKIGKESELLILVEALQKIKMSLLDDVPAEITTENMNTERIHIYTDASTGDDKKEKPMIGGVARIDGRDYVFSYVVKDWLMDKIRAEAGVTKVHIGILEALAVWAALIIFDELIGDKWLVLHVDNVGDVYGFTSGGSKCPGSQGIIDTVVEWQRSRKKRIFFVYIRSAKNIADATTRVGRMNILGATLEKMQVLKVSEKLKNEDWYSLSNLLQKAKRYRFDTNQKLMLRKEERKKNLEERKIVVGEGSQAEHYRNSFTTSKRVTKDKSQGIGSRECVSTCI